MRERRRGQLHSKLAFKLRSFVHTNTPSPPSTNARNEDSLGLELGPDYNGPTISRGGSQDPEENLDDEAGNRQTRDSSRSRGVAKRSSKQPGSGDHEELSERDDGGGSVMARAEVWRKREESVRRTK